MNANSLLAQVDGLMTPGSTCMLFCDCDCMGTINKKDVFTATGVGALYPNKKARYRKRIARSWGTVSYFWCKFSVKIIILIYPVAELYRSSSR